VWGVTPEPIVNHDVLALDVAPLLQPLADCVEEMLDRRSETRQDHSYPRCPCGLLGAGCQRHPEHAERERENQRL
jgi:hypothetical protein